MAETKERNTMVISAVSMGIGNGSEPVQIIGVAS
jgi:hypothetical protein